MNVHVPLLGLRLRISLEKRNALRYFLMPESPLLELMRSETKFSGKEYGREKQRSLAFLSYLQSEPFWKKDAGYEFCGKHLARLIQPGCVILDVGCSVGHLPVYLKHLELWDGVTYFGVDLDRADIGVAQQAHSKGAFVVCDIQQTLPFRSPGFDIVYSKGTIISTYFPYRALDAIADVASKYLILVHTPLTARQTPGSDGFISMVCASQDNAYVSTVMQERLFMERISDKGFTVSDVRVRRKPHKVENFGTYRLYDFLLVRT